MPTASITPKLHMLEDHVMPWVRKWKLRLGFHGEQGAESIHARFHSMQRTYANVEKRYRYRETESNRERTLHVSFAL